MRRRRWVGGATIATALLLSACGDDGDGAASIGEDPSVDECVDALITAMNQFDTSGLDPSDGFDDAERATAEGRFEELAEEHPALEEGGPCQTLIEEAPDEQAERMLAEVDPEVVAILGASATQQFDEVGETIE